VDNARKGRVGDLGGAVSTVTNYGTFGLTWATAIPQPDHSMILGIGAVRYVPDWNPGGATLGPRARSRADPDLRSSYRRWRRGSASADEGC
jgi:pyruvate/2-oxoglutarate dehydrogenase complex dihydrolipoamide acyltransferase (E2) component